MRLWKMLKDQKPMWNLCMAQDIEVDTLQGISHIAVRKELKHKIKPQSNWQLVRRYLELIWHRIVCCICCASPAVDLPYVGKDGRLWANRDVALALNQAEDSMKTGFSGTAHCFAHLFGQQTPWLPQNPNSWTLCCFLIINLEASYRSLIIMFIVNTVCVM